MTRTLLNITSLGVILYTLAGCSQQTGRKTTSANPDVDVVIGYLGGAPEQEIALNDYKTLTGWAKAYPQLRPAIIHALANDGKVTYAELNDINQQQQTFADAEDKKKRDADAKPYRQALRKAAQS